MSYLGLHYLVALSSIPSPPPTIIVRQEGGGPSWVLPVLTAVIGAAAAIVGGVIALAASREERVWQAQLDAYYGIMTWWNAQERELKQRLSLLESETYMPTADLNKLFSAPPPEVETKFSYFSDSASEKKFADLQKAVNKLEEHGIRAQNRDYYQREYNKLLEAGKDFKETNTRAIKSGKRTLKRGQIIRG